MKKRVGSAMLLVLLLAASISAVLIRIYYRCALLQQTVADRQKQFIWRNGAQACMQYAIHLAKANWDYIATQSLEIVAHISWALGKKLFVPAVISFRSGPKMVYIAIQLYDDMHNVKQQISCLIKLAKEGEGNRVIIADWCEKN